MKTVRVRTYYVDPFLRKKRVYTFRASRTVVKPPYVVQGVPVGRERRIRYEGYGSTPRRAQIDLRRNNRSVKRLPKEIITKEDLILNRRLVKKWEQDQQPPNAALRHKIIQWLKEKSEQETKDVRH